MKKTTTTTLSLILLSLIANFAAARDLHRDDDRRFSFSGDEDRNEDRCGGDRRCVSAPEIDPAQALAALTLLGGTIAIVHGYRRSKK